MSKQGLTADQQNARSVDGRFGHTRSRADGATAAGRAEALDDPPFETPVIELNDLCHIGTLDPGDKGNAFNQSYEGDGLSFSFHPDAWEQIAKLGGNPRHQLSVDGGGEFIDAHALREDHVDEVEQWAVDNGFGERREAWTVTYIDEDTDETMSFTCPTQQDAVDEASEIDEATVEQCEVLYPTQATVDRFNSRPDDEMFWDHTVVLWGEHNTDADGVWWDDQLDPGNLSAPRGVIFRDKADRWTAGAATARPT